MVCIQYCPRVRVLLKHILAFQLFFIWTRFKTTNVKNNISLQRAYSSDDSFSNWVNLRQVPSAGSSHVRVLFSVLTLGTSGLGYGQSQRRLETVVANSLLPAATHAKKRRYFKVCVDELMTKWAQCHLRALYLWALFINGTWWN